MATPRPDEGRCPAVISSGQRRAPGGRRWALATTALAATVALTCCAGEPPQITAGESPTTAPTAATPSVPGHTAESLPAPLPHPSDDAASQGAALDLGLAAVTAFARPDVSSAEWWTELSPMLSPAAMEAYVGTDPVQVPAREVTGPAWTGVSPSPFLATVFVPTDAGEYAVLMVREGGGAPWLVERITRVEAAPTEATPSATENPPA